MKLLTDTKHRATSLSGYRYIDDGGTDRREILHDDAYRSPPLWAVSPGNTKIPNFGPTFS